MSFLFHSNSTYYLQTFLSHSVSRYDETYFGEMDGNVVAILTNHKTGKKSTSKIGGRRYFGMSTVDDDY